MGFDWGFSATLSETLAVSAVMASVQVALPGALLPEPVTCDVWLGVRVPVPALGVPGTALTVHPLSGVGFCPLTSVTTLVMEIGTRQVAADAMSLSWVLSSSQVVVWK